MPTERSKTDYPDITVYTQPGWAPRYVARIRDKALHLERHLGSFGTIEEALDAQFQARELIKQGRPIPPVVRWRRQSGAAGVKERKIAEKSFYYYEVNLTKKNGGIQLIRSQYFPSKGQALGARTKALELINHGKEIKREGISWKEIRYPIDWIRGKVNPQPKISITVKDWIVVYFQEIVCKAPIDRKLKRLYKCHLIKHIAPVLGLKQVRSLDHTIVELVGRKLESEGKSESQKTVRTTMWRMMEAAIANGIREDNPVRNTPLLSRRLEYQRAKASRPRKDGSQQTNGENYHSESVIDNARNNQMKSTLMDNAA
jgi:hypothetical protein